MGSELQSHDHGSQSPSCRHHRSMGHPRSSQWRACCRLCTCDVVTDQVPRRLTPLYRPLWLRSPLGSESPRPGRKRGPSRSGFKLAHNKHTRTKISSAIDGQLLIQHHINQQGNKLQIVHNNIIQMQKYTFIMICRSTLVTLLRQPIIWGCTVVGLTKDELWMKGLLSKP